jgi:SAM-dependent methyltransferase
MSDSQQDLDAEKKWHENRFYIDSGHWTSHPLFASRERHWLLNQTQMIRFYGELARYIDKAPYRRSARVLLAPVGNGGEYAFLQGLAREVHGIDISPISLAQCPSVIETREGDILHSGYPDGFFDVVVCSQFLHHVHSVGFVPFLREYNRVLRSGGTLGVLEPSALFPVFWATSTARRVLGNVTGLVDDERPVHPPQVTRALHEAEFVDIESVGLVSSHVRFPTVVQHTISALDYPMRKLWPLKLFCNSLGWFARKR